MARDAGRAAPIEVVVRFAGDLVDVARVPAGSTYSIGTESLVAIAGSEHTIGLVTVTMERAAAKQSVPRRRLDPRPYVYGAGSLAGHLALVVAALLVATSDPMSAPVIELAPGQQRGGVRIKHFVTDAQTIKREPEPAADVSPTEQPTEERIERDTPAPEITREFTPSEITGGGLADGPKDSDGTSRRFDPSSDPAFDTIKSGDYSTVSTGHLAGDHYGPLARNSSLVVITCDRITCLVVGGEKATQIRRAVEERVADLTECYKQAALAGGGSVEIDFGVDDKGGIKNLEVGQVDHAGLCVAKILRTLQVDEQPTEQG